jgi:hypothetical protein
MRYATLAIALCGATLSALALDTPVAQGQTDSVQDGKAGFGADTSVSESTTSAKTIGLAVTSLRWALYETPNGKEECPAGLQIGPIEQFKSLPDPIERLAKYGYNFNFYGPNGENADTDPLKVTDPLPWKELRTTKGYGINLDDTTDGHATAKTCKHEKFTDSEGEPVDNQSARAIGCADAFRTGGFTVEFYNNEVVTSPVSRHLIEVTGVDSETDDPDVEVAIYKGRDGLLRRADGTSFVAFMSQRVDARFPQYVLKTHGKIVNGILITDPIPLARMPIVHVQVAGEWQVQDMVLRLKLNPESAQGYLSGYERLDHMWSYLSKSNGPASGHYSPAGLYRALLKYADGYPDPTTGQCNSISTAYKLSAVRAIIVHPGAGGFARAYPRQQWTTAPHALQ